ncbi:MAG: EH signature domain-containing protein [bacterium]
MDPAAKTKEFLNITFDPVQFARGGENWIRPDVRRAIEKGTETFKRFVDDASRFSDETADYAPEYYARFMGSASRDQQFEVLQRVFSSRRDRLRLARILMYRPDHIHPPILLSNQGIKAIQFLNHCWFDSMIAPLMNIFLKYWRIIWALRGDDFQTILMNKIKQYEGKRPSIRNLQANLRFFKIQTGPAQFAAALLAQDKSIADIYAIPPFSPSMHGYEYISEYAVQYIRLAGKAHGLDTKILSIVKFLEEFGCTFTYQRGIPPLIIHAYQRVSPADQETLFREAIRIMGDPADPVKWRPMPDLQPEEKNDFEKARNILNEWLTRQYIDVFFELIATDMDKRRKIFWRKFLQHITTLKIFGKQEHRNKLRHDERIRDLVDFRFGNMTGSSSNDCALCFQIKNRLFVEFNHHGNALYVYPNQANYCPKISETLLWVHQLKNDYYKKYNRHLLLKNNYDEGRLFHKDGWEDVLTNWLKTKMGI